MNRKDKAGGQCKVTVKGALIPAAKGAFIPKKGEVHLKMFWEALP